MAESVIKKDSLSLETTTATIGTVTLNNAGYLDVGSYAPTLDAKSVLNTTIDGFGQTSSAINVTANGRFLMGQPNATITNLRLRYYIFHQP